LDVIPAHVADDLEAIGEHLADGRLAVHAPAGGLGTAGHEEGRVVLEEACDAVHVAGVEGRVDLEQQLDAGAGRRLDHGAVSSHWGAHGRHSASSGLDASSAPPPSVAPPRILQATPWTST